MQITNADNYLLDSVIVPGYYNYGTRTTHTFDTIRLSILTGNGSPYPGIIAASGIFAGYTGPFPHYGSVNTNTIAFDSVNIIATNPPGNLTVVPYYMDILVNTTVDTAATENIRAYQIALKSGTNAGSVYYNGSTLDAATPISVPADWWVACAVTSISGDPATHGGGLLAALPGDTLIGAVTPYYRYNVYRPMIDYFTATNPALLAPGIKATPEWPPYSSSDNNAGLFNMLPYSPVPGTAHEQIYNPTWALSSAGGASPSPYQYPDIAFHILCSTCRVISTGVSSLSNKNSINAYPNPATNELDISFSLTQVSDVTVSFTNMLGQVVATRYLNNTAAGKAVFNTAALPAGIYVYALIANGDRTTGQVAIAH
jgi:type IX secretion system substrate protein